MIEVKNIGPQEFVIGATYSFRLIKGGNVSQGVFVSYQKTAPDEHILTFQETYQKVKIKLMGENEAVTLNVIETTAQKKFIRIGGTFFIGSFLNQQEVDAYRSKNKALLNQLWGASNGKNVWVIDENIMNTFLCNPYPPIVIRKDESLKSYAKLW